MATPAAGDESPDRDFDKDGSDDEGAFGSDGGSSDGEREERRREKKHKKRKKEKSKKTSSKRPRLKKSLFAEEAAEADDSDEEIEEDYEREEEIDTNEARIARERVDERHKLTRQNLERSGEEIAQEYERKFRESEKKTEMALNSFGGAAGAGAGRGGNTVSQQALLPGVGDPPIFCVKCKVGMEQLLTRSIIIRCLDALARGKNPHVMSAFCTVTKGYIYVEATAEPFAREAIANLRGIYQTNFTRIPVHQMTQLLDIAVTKKPLKVGQWARYKRTDLKGDLVRVVGIMNGGANLIIKAVPRPDYSIIDATRASRAASNSAQNGVRPTPRLFSPEEAAKAGCKVDRSAEPPFRSNPRDLFYVWNNDYFLGGFVYRLVKPEYVTTVNLAPKVEELKLFDSAKAHDMGGDADADADDFYGGGDDVSEESGGNARDGGGDSDGEGEGAGGGSSSRHGGVKRSKGATAAMGDDDATSNTRSAVSYMQEIAEQMRDGNAVSDTGSKNSSVPFVVGDVVQVIAGDLQHLKGRVIEINELNKLVKIMSIHEAFQRELLIEVALLAKYVKAGQHVKVVKGRNMGLTGRVVAVTEGDGGEQIAAVITDTTNSEIMCNVAHLQVSNEVASGLDSLGGYEMYDLASLSSNQFAVVVSIGNEKLGVMDHMGVVKQMNPIELQGKGNQQSNRTRAQDAQRNSIGVGDVVNVLEGPYAKRTGTIKHVYRSVLWLHSNNHLRDAGVFVVKSRAVRLAGKTLGASSTNAFITGTPSSTPSPSVNGTPGPGGGPAVVFKGGGRAQTNEKGSTVLITKGAFKGHHAQVVDATDTHYNVELLTVVKKIMIEKSKTKPVPREGGTGGSGGGGDGGMAPPDAGMYGNFIATPHLTAATPHFGFGSETPRSQFAGGIGNETPSVRSTMREEDIDVWVPGESDNDDIMALPTLPVGGSSSAGAGAGAMATGYGSNSSGFAPPPLPPNEWETASMTSTTSTRDTHRSAWDDASNSSAAPFAAPSYGAAAGVGASRGVASLPHEQWQTNFIVRILQRNAAGTVSTPRHLADRLAVVTSLADADGYLQVHLMFDNGEMEPESSNSIQSLHHSVLVLAEPKQKCRVYVVAGNHAAKTGVINSFQDQVVLVRPTVGNPLTTAPTNLVWIYK